MAGRPRKNEEFKRDTILHIRVNLKEYECLEMLSKLENRRISDVIRKSIEERYENHKEEIKTFSSINTNAKSLTPEEERRQYYLNMMDKYM